MWSILQTPDLSNLVKLSHHVPCRILGSDLCAKCHCSGQACSVFEYHLESRHACAFIRLLALSACPAALCRLLCINMPSCPSAPALHLLCCQVPSWIAPMSCGVGGDSSRSTSHGLSLSAPTARIFGDHACMNAQHQRLPPAPAPAL